MDALLLALRGMWWRRGVSLTILVIATFVSAAAASGPMFLRAGGESLLQDSLRQVDVATIGLSARVRGATGDPIQGLDQLDSVVTAARRGVPGYGQQVAGLDYVGTVVDPLGQTIASGTVAYRPSFCAHVVIRAGRCATAQGETIISAVTSAAIRAGVGSRLLIGGFSTPSGHRPLHVVGIYEPVDPHGSYWFDTTLFPSVTGALGEGTHADGLLTPESTFSGLSPLTAVDRVVEVPVDPHRLRLADVDAIRSGSARAMATITTQVPHANTVQSARIAVSGYVSWALDIARTQRDALRLPVALAIGQLLVLGWFALYMVVANATAARSGEVALAKLRGFSPGSTVAFALLETMLLLVVSVPLGLMLGRLGTTLLAHAHLAPGTPVVVSTAGVAAVLATTVGGLVAAALAARRVLRRSVPELMRRTAPTERGTAAAALEWVTMIAAAAALTWLWMGGRLELQQGQRLSVLPLLVPGLLAVAAATAAARVLPGMCRSAFPTTRATSRIGMFLAVRHVARRPSGLRVVVVLTTALGLVTFAVVAWSDFARNRHDRAMAETGAARVLTVTTPPGTDLLSLVRAADPSGRRAMAVASTEVGLTGATIYGFDLQRLQRVAFWRSDFGPSKSDIVDSLAADTSVSFRGGTLTVRAHVDRLQVSAPVQLVAVVGAASGRIERLAVAPLAGPGEANGTVQTPQCATAPCRLLALDVSHEGVADGDTSPIAGTVTVRSVSTDGGAVAAPVWTSARGGVTGDAAPTWRFAGRYSEQPSLHPATARPARLPVLASSEAHDGTTFDADSLAGTTPVAVTGRVARFPGLDRTALVGDLAALSQELGGTETPQRQQVWLTDGADGVVRRLRATGVRVLSDDRAATSIRLFGRQAPSLGLLLFLVGAASAAVLAAAGTVVDLHLVGRRRAFELAAMQAVGVRRRSLHAAVLTEQALLIGTGTVLGVACGLLGARLTLPSVPVYVDRVDFPQVLFMPDVALVAVFVGGVVAVVAAAVVVSSHLLVRAAVPSRLREAQA